MTQTYNEDVEVRGKLQIQETGGDPLTTLTEDGRIEIGDDLGLATPESLIEAHRAETSLNKPKRGIHSLGQIGGAISDVISWVVAELELPGTGAISGVHQALRARLTHSNSGDSSQAKLRAGEFEVINTSGTSGAPVERTSGIWAGTSSNGYLDKAVGVDIQLTNNGTVNEAVGLEVADVTGATDNYAIKTGQGAVRVGETLELDEQATSPAGKTGVVRMYAKNNGKIYTKNSAGSENELGNGFHLFSYSNNNVGANAFTVDLASLSPQLFNHYKFVFHHLEADEDTWLQVYLNGDEVNGNYRIAYSYISSIGLQVVNASYDIYGIALLGCAKPDLNGYFSSSAVLDLLNCKTAITPGSGDVHMPTSIYKSYGYSSDGPNKAAVFLSGGGWWTRAIDTEGDVR